MTTLRTDTTATRFSSFQGGTQDVAQAIRVARLAQPGWSTLTLPSRLAVLRRFRALAAEQASMLAALSAGSRARPVSEALTAEVVPLLEAVRFLERGAPAVLATRKLGRRGRPAWLFGVDAEIRREPLGVVLVIGPSNYPLFLPAVQAIQGLVAGNAVLVKPGNGGHTVLRAVADLLHHAGLDHRLLQVLPESSSAAAKAIDVGVDKVVLTGSAETGRLILGHLAHHLTPSVMELSGCDAVFVRADADLDLVVRGLRFGTLLNDGATCIAPRRVYAHRSIATELEGRIALAFGEGSSGRPRLHLKREWAEAVREGLSSGAHLVSGTLDECNTCSPPLIVAGVRPGMRLLQIDVFAPVLSLVTVADDHEAIELAHQCPYALGATVFSRHEREARVLADRIDSGVVVINDMIVPTADPRLPFAGRQRSGFGATRGAEGLLEMTAPKAVTVRRTAWLPHLEPARMGDEEIFANYLLAAHALGWRPRLRGGWHLLWQILRRRQDPANVPPDWITTTASEDRQRKEQ